MACGATWTAIIMNMVGVEACNGLINGSTMIMAEKNNTSWLLIG